MPVSDSSDLPPLDDSSSERRRALSRETLLLIGSLSFLLITVLLIVVFPASDNRSALTKTGTPATSTPGIGQTPAPYPPGSGLLPSVPPSYPIGMETPGYPGPNLGSFATPTTLGGYPNPNSGPTVIIVNETPPALLTAIAGGYPPPGLTIIPTISGPQPIGTPPLQPTLLIPTFDPARPPQVTLPPAYPGGLQPTVPVAPPVVVTSAPPPTAVPVIVQPPPETAAPKEPPPTPTITLTPSPTLSPTATSEPVILFTGNVHWSPAQGPIRLDHTIVLQPGASLIIEAGTEIRLARGVAIYVDAAKLYALGKPGQPVRFIGDTPDRWNGLFVRANSDVVLEQVEIHGGGSGGTLITADSASLVIRNGNIRDNGGTLYVTDSSFELRDSEISGNDMPYGGAINIASGRGNRTSLTGNRIGGNRLTEGAPGVTIRNTSNFDTLPLDVRNNMIRNEQGENLVIETQSGLQGSIACNTLLGGNNGLAIRAQTASQLPNFPLTVSENFFDGHTPPVDPIYLRFGIGRGVTSDVVIDLRNNWWGETSGPYDPQDNPEGRGDSVGTNISYRPWMTQPPACAPKP